MSSEKDFLTTQIITYIGNKRALIYDIESQVNEIKASLGKEKLILADLFSGSGIVSRMFKAHASSLIVNDIENYSRVINSCYLENCENFDRAKYSFYREKILSEAERSPVEGIVCNNYAPRDDLNIQKNERAFYTRRNAILIDTYRHLIDRIILEDDFKKFFLAPLITEASIHVNTSGVFKGFYKDRKTGIGCFGGSGKDALYRIKGEISLLEPVFSPYSCDLHFYTEDTVSLSKKIKGMDVTYLDPPYNQHPYGSNYFMLNLILENRLPDKTSRVSGIPADWNRSVFNKRRYAFESLEEIIKNLDSKFVIVSYNSEGFISFSQMELMLKKYGAVKTVAIKYNAFRGSRNLNGRALHVKEYIFVLKKN